jgi:hypothetical protein
MPLKIDTFSNIKGGNSLYKALVHPLAAEKAKALINTVAAAGPVAIYDPRDTLANMAELYDIGAWDIKHIYVQRIESLFSDNGGRSVLGRMTQPVTELHACNATTLFVAAFDTERMLMQIRHLIPRGVNIVTLDDMRLPDEMLTNPRNYLDTLNFATNFALFRDAGGQHTTVASCNYWHGYGAKVPVVLWLSLFGQHGKILAQWQETLPQAASTYRIDSKEIRARFNLPEFTGSLFIHAQHVAGHDVVKYALDTYGDADTELSCTHDANAWPADFYAGLPAPQDDERVILWIQNSTPVAIPRGGVGINKMGSDDVAWFTDAEIAPFATHALDVASLLPNARWPEQLEIHAGKYFVRPRYEVINKNGRRRIAHANVERTDLNPDPRLGDITKLTGKGYMLPAPILPLDRWRSIAMPTPMARGQSELPLAMTLFDASGEEITTYRFGRIQHNESIAVDFETLLTKVGGSFSSGYGHAILSYDFSDGGAADGWLHGLFRYEHKASGHSAETSFGAHIYNIPITYKDEPQSYIGAPPGLSTRLFLRLGTEPLDTLCHLIYPSSLTWHPHSTTTLILYDKTGTEIAQRSIRIACNGSLLWRYSEMFDAESRGRAGSEGAYVMIRDATCRLFGYHGLLNGEKAFSLDHMFGF